MAIASKSRPMSKAATSNPLDQYFRRIRLARTLSLGIRL
jgi:hypothetical protein